MKFWDSSAIVPLLVEQPSSPAVRTLFDLDRQVTAWAFSEVEFRAAVCRLWRERALDDAGVDRISTEFDQFWAGIQAVTMHAPVVSRAKRLLGVHALRAGDALQLAAALVAAGDQPTGWEVVSLDQRLSDAARREGFRVLP